MWFEETVLSVMALAILLSFVQAWRNRNLGITEERMLVLTRKRNEAIVIADDVTVTVLEIRGDKVRLGIAAPRDVSIHRQEVWAAIHGAEASHD